MFGDLIQPTHLLFVLVVALLVLGPKRLPEVGRSLGRGLRDFREGMQGVQNEARSVFGDVLDEPAQPPVEPITPPIVEPVTTPVVESAAAVASSPAPSLTHVASEPDPADYAD